MEDSEAERSATAKLSITVKPVDSNPPVISASAIEGYVDENAPVGTKVTNEDGKPIVLSVSDADLVSIERRSNYIGYRLTGIRISYRFPLSYLYGYRRLNG